MIIHCHVPKTAGHSFDAVLKATFGQGHLRVGTVPYQYLTEQHLKLISDTHSPDRLLSLSSHHVTTRLAGRYFPKATTAMFLREPRERFYSQFAHLQRQQAVAGTHPYYFDARARTTCLENFVDHYREFFPGNAITNYVQMSPQEMLLEVEQVHWLGLTERFADSLALFQQEQQVYLLYPENLRQNTNPLRGSGESYWDRVSPQQRDMVERAIVGEESAYQYALELFDKRYRARDRNLFYFHRMRFDARGKLGNGVAKRAAIAWRRLREQTTGNMYLYGAGLCGVALLDLAFRRELPMPDAVLDDEPPCERLLFVPVYYPGQACPGPRDTVIIASDTPENLHRMNKRIKSIAPGVHTCSMQEMGQDRG